MNTVKLELPLEPFLQQYRECALWSSCATQTDEYGNAPYYDETDMKLHAEALKWFESDCKEFISHASKLEVTLDELAYLKHHAGEEFWLTREHHGSGFWDKVNNPLLSHTREVLTELSRAFGEASLQDDGKYIYQTSGNDDIAFDITKTPETV